METDVDGRQQEETTPDRQRLLEAYLEKHPEHRGQIVDGITLTEYLQAIRERGVYFPYVPLLVSKRIDIPQSPTEAKPS
jgi:hypothetical protein